MGRRRKKEPESSGADIGLMMTVSLFLILLTFFILLNSIAVLDDNRKRLALGSLIGAFGILPGGFSALESGDSVLPSIAPIVDANTTLLNIVSRLNHPQILASTRVNTVSDKGESLVIDQALLFKDGIHDINPVVLPLLAETAAYIKAKACAVEIAGHTDNMPAADKGFASNWEMSVLMAARLLRFMVDSYDLNPAKMTAVGCGSEQPLADNQTAESRARNRRVEIRLNYQLPSYVQRIRERHQTGHIRYKKFFFKLF